MALDRIISTQSNSVISVAAKASFTSVKSWYSSQDFNGSKAATYFLNMSEKYCKVQILGMSRPRELSSVYVSIRGYPEQRKHINKKPESKDIATSLHINKDEFDINGNMDQLISEMGYSFLNAEDIEVLSHSNENFHTSCTIEKSSNDKNHKGIDAFNFVESNDSLLILGQPGSGKTTFLKALTLAYGGILSTEGKISITPKIPIYIRLREYADRPIETPDASWFMDVITNSTDELSEKSFSDWLRKEVVNGNCIIFADGIDEVPKNKLRPVLTSFKKFANKYSKNKFVATCRTSVYNQELDRFRICEIDDFNNNDITIFIKKWFDNDTIADQLTTDIHNHAHVTDLMKTPLLCTLVCIMYEKNLTIPLNRSELYESCIDTMMSRWDTQRMIRRDGSIEELTLKNKKYILSEAARTCFDENRLFIPKETLLKYLSAELLNIGFKSIDSENLLIELEENMGLLVEHSHNIYAFSHLTFQEFFTAISYTENKEGIKLAELAFNQPKYKEVLLLALERMYKSDETIVKLCALAKHNIINRQSENRYIEDLINSVIRSNITCSQKIKKLLNTISADLLSLY